MKAIILSAGQGRRLLPLTTNMPKCALPLRGRSLLQWQLKAIARCDIAEVVVVTGFAASAVDTIVEQPQGVSVRTLYNPFYDNCDNLGTCWIARSEMNQPFVLINGDTLFEAAVLQKLLNTPATAPVTLVTDEKACYDEDDMKVIVADGWLQRVGKNLDPAAVNGESIGMMAFRGDGPTLFRNHVDYLMRHGEGLRRWYLTAIDALAREQQVHVCSAAGLSWCEIDDRADLEHAETVVGAWYPALTAVSSG